MLRPLLVLTAIAGIAAQTAPPDLRSDLLVATADLARQLNDPALVVLHVAD